MGSPSAKPCYLSGHTLLSQTALRWYISDQGSSVNEALQDRPITEGESIGGEEGKDRLQYVKRRPGVYRLEYQAKAPRQGQVWEEFYILMMQRGRVSLWHAVMAISYPFGHFRYFLRSTKMAPSIHYRTSNVLQSFSHKTISLIQILSSTVHVSEETYVTSGSNTSF